MTEEMKTLAQEKLERVLGSDAPDDDLLADYLEEAETEICLFLGVDEVSERLITKLVALAACYVRRDLAAADMKSTSFSEGRVSESETRFSPEEQAAQAEKILDSLRRFRVVRVGGAAKDEET